MVFPHGNPSFDSISSKVFYCVAYNVIDQNYNLKKCGTFNRTYFLYLYFNGCVNCERIDEHTVITKND